eukprot:COSAG02_NODE_51751_length_312_cov_0.723005_1_plen_95_part_01
MLLGRLTRPPSCSACMRRRLVSEYIALVLEQDAGDQSGVEGPAFVNGVQQLGDACMLQYYTKVQHEVQLTAQYSWVPSAIAWLGEAIETVPCGER